MSTRFESFYVYRQTLVSTHNLYSSDEFIQSTQNLLWRSRNLFISYLLPYVLCSTL